MLLLAIFGLSLSLYAALPDPTSDFPAFLTWMFDAVTQGQWKYVAAGVLILSVGASKLYGAKYLPFLTKGRWVWLYTVLSSAMVALAVGLGADQIPSFSAGLAAFLSGAFVGLAGTGIHKGMKEWGLLPTKKPPA